MYQKELERYFEENKEAFLDAICRLIRIESIKGPEEPGSPFGKAPAEALEEALRIAAGMGFAVRNYENYVGTVDFQAKETQLDILAHLDVVPAGEDWTVTRPFAPVIKDGRLYGRGSADDKGPAMAALFAMKAIKDLGIPLEKNVRLIFGTDEENNHSDIAYYYEREKEAPMTFSPDADFPVIHIEKGGLQADFAAEWQEAGKTPGIRSLHAGLKINVIPGAAEAVLEGFAPVTAEYLAAACKTETGVCFTMEKQDDGSLRVTATGQSGHAAFPADANNALTAMLELLSRLPAAESEGLRKLKALQKLFPHGDWRGRAAGVAMADEESGELTISLDTLDYEDGRLAGSFDCRAPLCATDANLRDVIRAGLAGAGIQMEDKAMFAPHHVPVDSHFVQTLLKCYTQYTGLAGKPLAIGGATYVHKLKNGVAFGCTMPGTNNRMHGADEFAVVEELVTSAKIFAQAIIDLCS